MHRADQCWTVQVGSAAACRGGRGGSCAPGVAADARVRLGGRDSLGPRRGIGTEGARQVDVDEGALHDREYAGVARVAVPAVQLPMGPLALSRAVVGSVAVRAREQLPRGQAGCADQGACDTVAPLLPHLLPAGQGADCLHDQGLKVLRDQDGPRPQVLPRGPHGRKDRFDVLRRHKDLGPAGEIRREARVQQGPAAGSQGVALEQGVAQGPRVPRVVKHVHAQCAGLGVLGVLAVCCGGRAGALIIAAAAGRVAALAVAGKLEEGGAQLCEPSQGATELPLVFQQLNCLAADRRGLRCRAHGRLTARIRRARSQQREGQPGKGHEARARLRGVAVLDLKIEPHIMKGDACELRHEVRGIQAGVECH
mmetsp:Transcript_75414/g.213316  ORF Transcript_75414/g.213316 Transcript_75414/m.213316 type:complete len:367 (-) Transcript_75414:949-2049(-)